MPDDDDVPRRVSGRRSMSSDGFDVVELTTRRGPAWFADLAEGEVTAKVLASSDRAGIGVQMVELQGPTSRHEVVVKRYCSRPATLRMNRPRLGEPDDPSVKPECEFAALVELHRALGSAGLGCAAVRPIDFVDDHRAIVMERFAGTDARRLMRRANERGSEVAAAGGAALAFAHRVLERPERQRLATSEEIGEAFGTFCDHLAPSVPERLIERTRRWWRSAVPGAPPVLAACHVDSAPRNLLVDTDMNAAWIDGLFRWRAPVYQDIAVFVTSVQVRSRLTFGGLRRGSRDRRAQAFIDGYRRHGELQAEWLPPFEALVLLDRLASLVDHGGSARRRLVKRAVEAELATLVGGRA